MLNEQHHKKNFLQGFWSNTNWAVQLQKMVGGLKFRIKEVEGLSAHGSENKGTDQMRGLILCS